LERILYISSPKGANGEHIGHASLVISVLNTYF